MPEIELALSPPRQAHVLGRGVGALRIKRDAADPEAVIGVFDPEAGAPHTRHVRPGDEFTVAGMRFRVTAITPPPGGRVDVVVTWPDGLER
jgi:hypothetical protein